MAVHLFALRVEPHRLVAAEITDGAAAALVDAGEPVLLGTVEELRRLAFRLRRPLVTISRAPSRPASKRDSGPVLASAVGRRATVASRVRVA